MLIVLAGFTAFGGLVALLAGAYGLRETRRIREAGLRAWALVKPAPPGADRRLLQFETADGRVLEIPSPARLEPGTRVELSYAPDDPRDVVLLGRERAGADRWFVAAGAAVLTLGLALIVAGL
ncbi:DUF3592 domain-containing protein [Streptomyces sp. NBC_01465]|uniref:DUF3592 domain-containing protein n=1 Tax=Streptomyces sp. NBC_01465 TaxID=2903878 RepID=UPI002E374B0F|nr:DUF3592 domain-containing protein [Streptomyces sp. NBC_01465]